MKQLIIADDPFSPDTWIKVNTDHVSEALYKHYGGEFPANARLYHSSVAQINDITPNREQDIEALNTDYDVVYCVVYPGDPVTLVVAVVAVAATAAAAFLLRPTIPTSTQRNRRSESPNNSLSERQNQPRLEGRIPDIFGEVRSTPDMLGVPLNVFEDHIEVEYAYMCIGRGEYDVNQLSINDDVTPIQQISGASVEVYGPNTSPNSNADPQILVGTAIDRTVKSVYRSNSVNGQVMRPPNSNSIGGSSDIRFAFPDEIIRSSSSELDFTDAFSPNDTITVTNATDIVTLSSNGFSASVSVRYSGIGTIEFENTNTNDFDVNSRVTIDGANFTYNNGNDTINLSGTYTVVGRTSNVLTLQSPSNINPDWLLIEDNFTNNTTNYATNTISVDSGQVNVDLSGTYTILSVTSTVIVLSNPSLVNQDWGVLGSSVETETQNISPQLSTSSDTWVGPFTLNVLSTDEVVCNFVALNGLYKDNGEQQLATNVTIELEITEIDVLNNQIGEPTKHELVIVGSSTTTTSRNGTIYVQLQETGRYSVRARRLSPTDLEFTGSVIDEVQWRDMYELDTQTPQEFGNVTTVWARTIATSGALSIRDRKLNMMVTRRVPIRVSGNDFTAPQGSTSIDDILVAVSLDSKIGNRSLEELDLDNIYSTISGINSYFGTNAATTFGYTFDNQNMSFEETIASMANSVFCTAYREGNQIKLSFERQTDDSVLLFNHRNKLPNTETRTVSFGNVQDNDGVELEYVDPTDDALVTYYIPTDRTATNPQRVETIGVRSALHAYFHAWRVYNKMLRQNVSIEFEATQEADLLVLKDRILVADNTRDDTQDGEIVNYDVLVVTLSQPIVLENEENYVMFVQHVDGTTEVLQIVSALDDYNVTVASPPRDTLSTDPDNYARSTYIISRQNDTNTNAYLLTEKETQGSFSSTLRAVNYDDRYYSNDADYINGVVDINGNQNQNQNL